MLFQAHVVTSEKVNTYYVVCESMEQAVRQIEAQFEPKSAAHVSTITDLSSNPHSQLIVVIPEELDAPSV